MVCFTMFVWIVDRNLLVSIWGYSLVMYIPIVASVHLMEFRQPPAEMGCLRVSFNLKGCAPQCNGYNDDTIMMMSCTVLAHFRDMLSSSALAFSPSPLVIIIVLTSCPNCSAFPFLVSRKLLLQGFDPFRHDIYGLCPCQQ